MTLALLRETWPGAELVTRLGRVCTSIAVGGAVLAAAALMLRIRELEQVGRQVLARLARNR